MVALEEELARLCLYPVHLDQRGGRLAFPSLIKKHDLERVYFTAN